ncbi:Fic family protein [Cellulomonas olei]|uniref:Fic family protein n=1 Tax=Cellulomonas sp. P4 TaxID=3142533 RepID=UPI0031B9CE87
MTGDLLVPLLDLPGVRDAVDRARVACEELRWHEAFRRRWREVRAEADLRAARASAAVDGAPVPLSAVRALATGSGADAGDGALRLAGGSLRATVLAATWRPDLGGPSAATLPPLGHVLARLHAAAGAGWLPDEDLGRVRGAGVAPRDLGGLGPAPDGGEVAERLALLTRTVTATRAPGLVVAAVAHGELLALRPFAAGNGVVARAAARLLLTTRGLDPTGAVVPEVVCEAGLQPYLAAAARFATGTPDGVAAWLVGCADAVVRGADEGRAVADAVLAGRLGAV